MNDLTQLLILLLSAMGLTIMIVWPTGGPGAWVREKLLRPVLGGRGGEVLDCYICFSFWAGLLVGTVASRVDHLWPLAACLMTPVLFWVSLRGWESADPPETPEEGER